MTNYQNDTFFQYPRTKYPTVEGDVEMPILYYDASVFMAIYYVDSALAQAQLDAENFVAVPFGSGKTLAVVAFYEYRDTSIGAYNEVGVAIAATPPGVATPSRPLLSMLRHPDYNRVGLYVIDLPVTTPLACAGGRDVYGLPKFVTPISFRLAKGSFDSTVKDPVSAGDILRISGKAGIGVPGPLFDLVLYTRHRGHLLRSLANTRGGALLCRPGSVRLVTNNNPHPMAQRLRALGIDGKKPAFVTYSHTLQLRLNAGAPI